MGLCIPLRDQAEIDAFQATYPDGYTILNGDRGVGLTGDYARRARCTDPDSPAWDALVTSIEAELYPALAAAYE